MEEQEKQVEVPVEGTGGAQETPQVDTYYQRFSEDFGVKVKDEESYKSFVQTIKNPAPAKPQFNEEWEGHLYDRLRSAPDENARRAALSEFAFVNGRDWGKLAEESPSEVLKASIRIANPHLNDKQVDILYKKEFGSLHLDPKAYIDEEGNPTVENPDEEVEYNRIRMRDSVTAALNRINEKRVSLTPPKQPDHFGEAVAKYSEAAKAAVSSFQFGSGDNIWKPEAKDVEELSKPENVGNFIASILNQDGSFKLSEIARLLTMKRFLEGGAVDKLLSGSKAKAAAELLKNNMGEPSERKPAHQPNNGAASSGIPAHVLRNF